VGSAVGCATTTTTNNTEGAQFADDFLHYEADYKVLICKEHGYALRSLSTHLCDQHSIPAKARKVIVEKYESYALLGPKDISLPPFFQSPFEALAALVKAFLCDEKECSFISKNCGKIARHCNQVHGWKSGKKDREHWTNVQVQTFFASSGFQRYFIVRVPEEQGTRQADLGDDGEGFVAMTLRAWKKTDEDHEKSQEVADAQVAKTDRTGWYNCTGWPEHVAKRNLTLLAHARRLPDRDEKELQQVMHAVDVLIERCVAGLLTLALETRRWLKSAKREEIDVRPMGRLQNPESQKRYARYWKQFICYCLRIVAAEEEDDGTAEAPSGEDEVEDDSDAGDDNIHGRTAEGEGAGRVDGEGDDEDEDEGGDNMKFLRDARSLFRWQRGQKRLAKKLWHSLQMTEVEDEDGQILTDQVLQLSASFIFQSVGKDPFDSGLVHFLAVLGIDEDLKRLQTANDFSFMLAGMVYCVQVLAIETLLPSTD